MNINIFFILFAILIAIIAQATNTNLVNNTTFLLLLLWALIGFNNGNRDRDRDNCYVYGQQRGFI